MALYEENELLIIVRDACDILMTTIKDEILPQFPQLRDEDGQNMLDILNAVKGLDTTNDIQMSMIKVAHVTKLAANCGCEVDTEGRHEFFSKCVDAFQASGEHIANTIMARMVREYEMDDGQAGIIFKLMQAGIFNSSDQALSQFTPRQSPPPGEIIEVPDYIPEDMTKDES